MNFSINLKVNEQSILDIHRIIKMYCHEHQINDEDVNAVISSLEKGILENIPDIRENLQLSFNHYQFYVKFCKVNDLLYDLEKWEYLFERAKNKLEYLEQWENEIKRTAI